MNKSTEKSQTHKPTEKSEPLKPSEKESEASITCIVDKHGVVKIPKELLGLIGIRGEENVVVIPGRDHLKIYVHSDFCKLFGNY